MKKAFLKFSVISLILFNSCASVVKNTDDSQTNNKTERQEARTLTVITPEDSFLTSIKDIQLKVTQVPKQVTLGPKNVNFAVPFEVSVENSSDNTPVPDFAITVKYPSSKSGDQVVFTEETVTSDENGKYSFLPSVPLFASNTEVYFYPTPINNSEKALNGVKQKEVSAAWKVRSDIINKGALLFIWEFTERDRPTGNSYTILSQLKAKGIWNVGNAPVNESTDLSKSLKTLYRENYEIVENAYGYLICGTVKFAQPVAPVEDGEGYLCSLVADISAVNMRNGEVVYTQHFTNDSIGANWNKATGKCKEELAVKITESLIYGL